ncbi:MAG: hypothetical protein IH945_10950, partial [Armatimonadetes bacterium]|nr:hypothetical protein [Armatimonadota bacterium]
SGVSTGDIVVLGNNKHPQDRYERLCLNSQIPPHERLRSNSEARPDNLWGFPGFAVRETLGELRRGNLKAAAGILWSIFGEPAFAESYPPRSGDVFRTLDREVKRIGWERMLRLSRIIAIRKSEDGRLLAFASAGGEGLEELFVVSARFVHLAIGYPAIRLLRDLAKYREIYWDRARAVNAYEPHEHLYSHLRQHGGTVLVRGRGIVASRIIQRLFETRQELLETRQKDEDLVIIHLHRDQKTMAHRYGRSGRVIEAQFEHQPFNWPKSAWSGEQRRSLESATDDVRNQLLKAWEGTTTSKRRDWRQIIEDGTRDGWYQPVFGSVTEVRPTDEGVDSRIILGLAGGGVQGGRVVADWPGLRPDQLTGPGDLQVTTDYRDVLAEMLANRLGNRNIDEVFPGHRPKPVGVFSA